MTGLQASTSKQTDLWNLRLLQLWNNPFRDGGGGGGGSTTHNAHLPYPLTFHIRDFCCFRTILWRRVTPKDEGNSQNKHLPEAEP